MGRFHVWITDVEARQFQGHDENGKPRSPNGRFRDAPQVLGGSSSAVRQHLQQHRRLLMYTKYGAVLPRSRTENNKTSTWNTMVITQSRFTSKLVRER